MLTFASVCSGIGGADLGLERAGMRPLWFCEKDQYARAQLFRHWPTTTCYEDLTRLDGRKLERPDVLHGSTPCQGVSIAGLRKSMQDPRTNLCFSFVRLCDELNPQYITWENVPGVLSTKDNAFGCFLAALVGFDRPLIHPDIRGFKKYWRGKPGRRFHVWPNCGLVIGPRRVAAWRVLDSQFFGVAQRRRRVFVVVDSGDGSCAQILFEPEGLRRDSPPSRQAQESNPAAPGDGVAGSSIEDVAPPLLCGENSTGGHRPPGMCPDTVHSLQVIPPVSGTLTTEMYNKGRSTTEPCNLIGTLNSSMGKGRGAGQDANLLCADVAKTVMSNGKYDRGDAGHESMLVIHPVCSKWAKRSGGTAGQEYQNLLAFEDKRDPVVADDISPTLRANGGGNVSICFDPLQAKGNIPTDASAQKTNTGKVLRALREKIGAEAFTQWGLGVLDSFQTSKVLRPDLFGQRTDRAEEKGSAVDDCPSPRKEDLPEGTMLEMRQSGRERRPPQGRELEEQLARELTEDLSQLSHQDSQSQRFMQGLWEADEGTGLLRHALSAFQEVQRSSPGATTTPKSNLAVRRLTELECERLQGFPDGWTSGQSSAQRYKQLGNAVTVSVEEWIGRRITKHHESGLG